MTTMEDYEGVLKASSKLLIKSGNLKLRKPTTRTIKEVYLEVYHQTLQLYEDEDVVDMLSLKNCWIALSTNIRGCEGFELATPARALCFVSGNYYDVDPWISAIKQAAAVETVAAPSATCSPTTTTFKIMSDYDEGLSDSLSSTGPPSSVSNIGQHSWIVRTFTKPSYCNVCRQSLATFQRSSLYCQTCKLKIHKRCAFQCHLDCKWTSLQSCGSNVVVENGEVKMCHQWIEGNVSFGIRCCVCSKKCGSLLRLQDFRCLWCRLAVHSTCLTGENAPSKVCTFDQCRLSVLLPTSVHARYSAGPCTYQAVKPISSSPLVVFINLKSGSQEGFRFMRRLRQLLNPIQVNSLSSENAAPGLLLCANLDSFRVLICGGDGSVGWVLSEIDKLGLAHKCHIGILPLGTGNDLSRVLGWGSTVSIKQDVLEVLSQMEQAKIKMLDRWSILTYTFPMATDRNPTDSPLHAEGTGIRPRSRSSPFAFVLRLEDQVSSQLEDLKRLCGDFSKLCRKVAESFKSSLSSNDSIALIIALRDNNREGSRIFDEISKRIRILPDLIHSYVSSISSVGNGQRSSQVLSAEIKTLCDAIEDRVKDLVRCWTLVQSRPAMSTENSTAPNTTTATTTTSNNKQINDTNSSGEDPVENDQPESQQHGNLQNMHFLRPPVLGNAAEFDSGCSSDFDVVEDVLCKDNSVGRLAISASTLVRSISVTNHPNPISLSGSIIVQLQLMIPQLSNLLISDSLAGARRFRDRCASCERTGMKSPERLSSSTDNKQHRKSMDCTAASLGVPVIMKASSCGTINTFNTSCESPFGGSNMSVGTDDAPGPSQALTSGNESPISPVTPTSLPLTQSLAPSSPRRKSSNNLVEAPEMPPAVPARKLFEKKPRPNSRWNGNLLAQASNLLSGSISASVSPVISKRFSSSSMTQQYNEKSPTRPCQDNGFIRQMLYSSARTLSSLCKQLLIPEQLPMHVTPGSAPFDERCVMNNYFGIGLDARIALDFHLRREETPESCKSRAKNIALYGMLGTKELVQQTYRNLEQRVQLECDGERKLLPSLQGIVIMNIPSYMGGVNFWGTTRATHGFAPLSFDDNKLEVVAIFGSVQMAASRVIKLHHHRIAQCRTVRITILDAPLPVQVDGEAWLHPPGVIVIEHKNRAQMLARDLDFNKVLRAWHQTSTQTSLDIRPQSCAKEHLKPLDFALRFKLKKRFRHQSQEAENVDAIGKKETLVSGSSFPTTNLALNKNLSRCSGLSHSSNDLRSYGNNDDGDEQENSSD